MSQAVFSVRMDEHVKKSFNKLCDDFGLSMSSAINLFAKTVIREGRIPFPIVSTETHKSNLKKTKGMQIIDKLRNDYFMNGGKELSLDEINEIIYEK